MISDSQQAHDNYQDEPGNEPDIGNVDVLKISIYMGIFTVVFFGMMAAVVPYFFYEVSREHAEKSALPRSYELTELRLEEAAALNNYDNGTNAITIDEAMHKVVTERQHH